MPASLCVLQNRARVLPGVVKEERLSQPSCWQTREGHFLFLVFTMSGCLCSLQKRGLLPGVLKDGHLSQPSCSQTEQGQNGVFRAVLTGDVGPVMSLKGLTASLEPGVCAMSSKVRLTSRGARSA